MAINDVIRTESHKLIVLGHLPRQLFQNLSGQLYTVVTKLLELYKLNQVSFCVFSIRVNHRAIVIIQFMHDSELSITNSNDDNWNWQSVTWDY